MTPDELEERIKNALIYGTSHPEIYMTKADELWEKHTACGAESGYMIYEEFLAALHEYGESVRQQAVRKIEIERDGYDLTGQNTDANGPNAYIVGYQVACTDCAAAIEKMELP